MIGVKPMAFSKAVRQKFSFLGWLLAGILLLALLVIVLQDPWVLVADPQWLGPTQHVYVLRPIVWWLGSGSLVVAGVGLVLGRKPLWAWVLGLVAMAAILGMWGWLLGLNPSAFNG